MSVLGEAATGGPLSAQRHASLVATFDEAAFGDGRANLAKNVPGSPDLFGGAAYRARGRSDAQMVRDVIEGVAHRAPTAQDYTAALPKMAAVTSMLDKYFAVFDVIAAETLSNRQALCTTVEADPVPATYVIGSDVKADGSYGSAYDTTGVQFRTEVLVVKKADAGMSEVSFTGDKPALDTAFTLRATTDAGRTALSGVKVGTRLAVETPGVEGSVLVKVESVSGSGDSRAVSGSVIELSDLIRAGSLDLTEQVNTAIGPALTAAVQAATDRAQSPEEVGTFYDQNGEQISTADATPGSDAASLTPAVWITADATDGICMNATNLSLKVALGSSKKGTVPAPDLAALGLLSEGSIKPGDYKGGVGATAKLDGRGCVNLQAKNWTVSAGKASGQIVASNSARFKISTKVSGEVAWEWKLLEKKFYVPVPIPGIGIPIPSTVAPGVSIPIKIEVSGGTGLTFKHGRQYTGGSITTTFDTAANPAVSLASTDGAWSDYGDQGASGDARLDGKVSIAVKPYLKFTFGDLAGAVAENAAFAVLPDWLTDNPWAQGFISLASEASIPELSGSLSTDEKCVGATKTATTRLKLTQAVKGAGKITIAEEALNKIGWTAPSVQLGIDILTASLPTLDVYTGPATGACTTPCPPGVTVCSSTDAEGNVSLTVPPDSWRPGTWRVTTRDYRHWYCRPGVYPDNVCTDPIDVVTYHAVCTREHRIDHQITGFTVTRLTTGRTQRDAPYTRNLIQSLPESAGNSRLGVEVTYAPDPWTTQNLSLESLTYLGDVPPASASCTVLEENSIPPR